MSGRWRTLRSESELRQRVECGKDHRMTTDMNYYDTFILVAEDCPATASEVPAGRGGRETVATIQHGMLAGRPYELTQEDVLFGTWRRQNPEAEGDDATLRAEYFAIPRACMRTSPLSKRHGWGLHFDAEGRVALHGRDSDLYHAAEAGDLPGTTITRAMRSRRA
jgi:hypothetical protein